jgi:GTP-binding protein
LTGAHVESTDYPFATKAPRLGTYEFASGRFQICELPSVYGHSAEGRGLGNSFLKHLKRAKLIAMVLDPLNLFAPTLKEGYDILMKAVTEFDARYERIPRLVVINKMDLKEAKKKIRAKSARFKDPHAWVSALSGEGLVSFIRKARTLIKKSETL